MRNVFRSPTKNDLPSSCRRFRRRPFLLSRTPCQALGIESLQKMGAKFLLCANALGGWCLELEARGKGKAADIEKDLRANLIPA